MKRPTANGGNGHEGRDPRGRFQQGNPGGPGNPFARHVAELRAAMLAAVTAERMAAVVEAMLTRAEDGDVQAARLVMSYTLGEPCAADFEERLERLEARSTLQESDA